jgi:phosphoenolpyruvate carboxykinase (ATP)
MELKVGSMAAVVRKISVPEEKRGSSDLDLHVHGLNPRKIHANLPPAALTEMALLRGEGHLTDRGALNAFTGSRTGRSPRDRFVVAESGRNEEIWWGPVNRPMEAATFDRLLNKVKNHLQGRELFVLDGAACADPAYRLNVRVITEKAWHALFAQALFLRLTPQDQAQFQPQFTIINACELLADPKADGVASEVFIVLNLERRLVLIGGTHYAGEMKKSVFSYLNYLLPQQGVFPMHCSANIGPEGDTALFFGLSGTGKTTLSADPVRRLIGDDEHGWSERGVFNIEGGCYAKTIRLSRQNEPQIWKALRFGCVLENVVVDPETRRPDFDAEDVTENTRAAYAIDFIDNSELSGLGGHPANIFFLACDAFGVLPPLSRLTPEQAMYHFLSGYTAKVAGTEAGITEPKVAFSTCFAAPFLPLHPTRYATMLQEKLQDHGATVWLLNTGWTGGAYGTGQRIKLSDTRGLLRAALHGDLTKIPFVPDPFFGVLVPQSCPGVPQEMLQPRRTWPDPAKYDAQARQLAALFRNNFAPYAAHASEAVRLAGPQG